MPITIGIVKRYIELGFVIHPCCPVTHDCQSPGKVPYDVMGYHHMVDWQNHEQFTIEQWCWFLNESPNINIGALCGSPSRLLFIDIDNKEAQDEFDRLEDRRCGETTDDAGKSGGSYPWQFETGRGRRYLFRIRGEAPRSSIRVTGDDCHIEILSDGKQSVLPPSDHISGKRYQWDTLRSPRVGECASVPRWAGGGGDPDGGGDGSVTGDKPAWTEVIAAGAVAGSRNDTLTRLAGHLIAPQPISIQEVAIWMRAYNSYFCKPPLPERELEAIITSISKREQASEGKIRKIMETHKVPRDVAEEYMLQDIEG